MTGPSSATTSPYLVGLPSSFMNFRRRLLRLRAC